MLALKILSLFTMSLARLGVVMLDVIANKSNN
jgi:hypothetical protein